MFAETNTEDTQLKFLSLYQKELDRVYSFWLILHMNMALDMNWLATKSLPVLRAKIPCYLQLMTVWFKKQQTHN